jgi:uncharacterized membrane protein
MLYSETMNSDEFDPSALTGAAAIGAVAGLRSMMAPALVSQAANTGSIDLTDTPFEFLSKQRSADISTGAAVLELIADKLPFTPNRTSPGPLIARAISGGLAGAAVCAARKKDWMPGAIAGATAAIAAAFAGYLLRRTLTRNAGLPDLLVALAEDAASIGLGVIALRSEANQRAAVTPL